ncbi:conserved hypothetical protein [Trichinella spiralis]|uniref:hypothetical protein n=1 Tax=Trichinella spiralis TaxID=6334 RepID=UPI0001EFE1E3|nr:conserved hypothetical protein [Trichinella spiralis]
MVARSKMSRRTAANMAAEAGRPRARPGLDPYLDERGGGGGRRAFGKLRPVGVHATPGNPPREPRADQGLGDVPDGTMDTYCSSSLLIVVLRFSVKNTASSLSLYVSCIVSALAKLELTLDSEYMVHYRLSEEFTARVAVNNINDDQK